MNIAVCRRQERDTTDDRVWNQTRKRRVSSRLPFDVSVIHAPVNQQSFVTRLIVRHECFRAYQQIEEAFKENIHKEVNITSFKTIEV